MTTTHSNAEKPHYLAYIREDECIGCRKCIKACPFDAIIGTKNQMHTVLTSECIGCELCVAPCPVDCIDLVEVEPPSKPVRLAIAALARDRYKARKARFATYAKQKRENYENAKEARKVALKEALARARKKKGN